MKKNQQGMTFLGVIFVGFMVVAVAILAMKLIPPYMEFWSVHKILGAMSNDPSFAQMTPRDVQESFDRRANIDYVTVIAGKDLDVSKVRGQTVAEANYNVTVPIVGNLSALIEFHDSTKGSKPAGKGAD